MCQPETGRWSLSSVSYPFDCSSGGCTPSALEEKAMTVRRRAYGPFVGVLLMVAFCSLWACEENDDPPKKWPDWGLDSPLPPVEVISPDADQSELSDLLDTEQSDASELDGDAGCGDACVFECAADDTCQFDCPQGGCRFVCGFRSDCRASCAGGGCELECKSGATCRQYCTGGSCTQSCQQASMCYLGCTGGDCSMNCGAVPSCQIDGCTSGCELTCTATPICETSCTSIANGCSLIER